MSENAGLPEPTKPVEIKEKRLKSLDALRGFDMFWLIGGTELFHTFFAWVYPPIGDFLAVQFNHCLWNGFTFYDLIFPLFLFMAGLSIPFSITKRREQGDKDSVLYLHILKRTLLLILLGLIYNGLSLDVEEIRWLGVLQRISIGYCVAALLAMRFSIKWQAIIAGFLLVGYWLLMILVPVPNVGAGILTPEGNLSFFIDRLLLPGEFCCFEQGDNEGILSTIPAIATAIFGSLTGHWLRQPVDERRKMSGLILVGFGSLGVALLWSLVFPINKYLWSSSFVMFAAGWSLLLVAIFHWIVDIQGFTKWAFPFIVIGMNSILVYMTKGLIGFMWLTKADPVPLPLAFALRALEIGVKWLIYYLFFRKRWFLKA